MEKQEKNQLKDLLKKYLDSTPMDSNQSSSANDIINMLDDSNTNGGPTKEEKNRSKKSATELNKDLEEANEFLKYVTNMYAKAFGIDESELEDSDNLEESDNDDISDDSVSVFDLDIKESEYISNNLYDWGLEDAEVDIDKDGNVLVYGLLPGDVLQFTEAFNDAFSKDMSNQDITDYLKDAYNRYNSNKPLKDSYEEGYPIGDDLRNGRVFLKDMVVKFPHMDAVEEEYDLFEDGDNFYFYFDGVKYILNKTPEASYFSLIDKVYPLYDNDSSKVGYHAHTPFEINKETPFGVSLDNMRVTSEDGEYTLVKLTEYNQELPHFSFVADNILFLIYFDQSLNAFYVSSKNKI